MGKKEVFEPSGKWLVLGLITPFRIENGEHDPRDALDLLGFYAARS